MKVMDSINDDLDVIDAPNIIHPNEDIVLGTVRLLANPQAFVKSFSRFEDDSQFGWMKQKEEYCGS